MDQSICSVARCERSAYKLRFCGAHYQRLKNSGSVRADEPIQSRVRADRSKLCVVEGCSRPMVRGVTQTCDAHYKRLWRNGDLAANVPVLPPRAASVPVVDFDDGTRKCQSCAMRKPLGEFHRDARAPLGRRKTCKSCRVDVEKSRYAADPEKFREKMRADRAADPERYRRVDMARYERDWEKRVAAATAYTHLRRARIASTRADKGISLAALRAMDGDLCCYCSEPVVFQSFPKGMRSDNQATLEHVLPISRGGTHTFDNCAIACWRCNISKGAADDWTVRAGHRLATEVIEVGA